MQTLGIRLQGDGRDFSPTHKRLLTAEIAGQLKINPAVAVIFWGRHMANERLRFHCPTFGAGYVGQVLHGTWISGRLFGAGLHHIAGPGREITASWPLT